MHFTSKTLRFFGSLIFLSCLLFSCKTKKEIIVDPDKQVTRQEVLESLLHPEFPEWVNAKAKARISSLYGSEKGQLYLRIRKDSVVWVAVKRLSIEGGRLQINKDSAVFINRLEKTWSSLTLADLQEKYGLIPDISYIQNLMAGIAPQIDTSRFFEMQEESEYFKVTSDIDGVMHTFQIDKNNGQITNGTFKTAFGIDGEWSFSDFKTFNNGRILPFKRNYHLNLGSQESIDLELDFSNIELNVPKAIKFEIQDHYIKM